MGVAWRAARPDLFRSLPLMPFYSLAEVSLAFLAAALLRLIYVDTPRVFVGDLVPERLQVWFDFSQSLDRKDLAFALPLLIIGTSLFKLVVSFASTYYMDKAGYFVSTTLREVLLESLLGARSERLQRISPSEISNRIMTDSALMQSAVSKGFLGGFRDLLVVVFCFAGMVVVASKFMVIVLLCLVPFVFLVRSVARLVQGYIRNYRRAIIELSAHAMDSRTGLLTLAAERTTDVRLSDFELKTAELRKTTLQTMGRRTLAGPFIEYLAIAGIAALLAFKNRLSEVDVAAYASLFILAAMSYRPLKNLGGFLSQFTEVRLTFERLNALWCENRSEPGLSRRIETAQGDLCRLMHVSYVAPDGVSLLTDFSFAVRAGDLVGFAGPSGSGKTTALRLLAGVLQPTSGRLAAIPAVRLATQAATVFAGTVAENISYHSSVDEEDLQDLVVSLGLAATPLGAGLFLGRSIGPSGEGLSGGERARVTLARVFAAMRAAAAERRPFLALFDEPTANLDAESSHLFWQLLRRTLDKGPTLAAICVTHHESDLMHCSRRLRFAAGRLVGEEPHV